MLPVTPLIVQSASLNPAPVLPAGDSIQAILPLFTVGEQVHATVLGQLANGNYAVLVKDHTLELNLPPNTEPGAALALRVVSKQSKQLSFLLLGTLAATAERTPPSYQVALSDAAQILELLAHDPRKAATGAQIHQSAGKTLFPPVSSPVLAPPQLAQLIQLTPQLAYALREALARSGLFYEAQLAAWASGTVSMTQLLENPQARPLVYPREFLGGGAEVPPPDYAIAASAPSAPSAATAESAQTGRSVAMPAALASTAPPANPAITESQTDPVSVAHGETRSAAPSPLPQAIPEVEDAALAAARTILPNTSKGAALGVGSAFVAEQAGTAQAAALKTQPPVAAAALVSSSPLFSPVRSPTATDTATSAAPSELLAAMPGGTRAVLQQQVHLLEQPMLTWQGMLAPGVPLRWEIQRDDTPPQHASAATVSSGWRMRIVLDLPRLGTVDTQLSLYGEKLTVDFLPERDAIEQMIAAHLPDFFRQLETAGLSVDASTGAPVAVRVVCPRPRESA